MPSQQGNFPKRSYSQKPKINSFPPTSKSHPLSPLTAGPPFLYWLGKSGRCSGPCVLVPLSSVFVFFHSHAVSAVPAMSSSVVCLFCQCLSSTTRRAWAFRLALFLLISSWVSTLAWHKFLPNQFIGLLSFFLISSGIVAFLLFLLCPWVYWLLFLPCRPIGFFYLFSQTFIIYLSFTSCCVHGPTIYYSCRVSSLGIFTLFSWTFITHLLYFYLLLRLWACQLLFLSCWPIESFYLFLRAFIAYLLYFYLLLRPWACWLLFLPRWLIGYFYLFSWAFIAHLLNFYLLLGLQACQLLFLQCWPTGSFYLFSWAFMAHLLSSCFFHSFSPFIFLH